MAFVVFALLALAIDGAGWFGTDDPERGVLHDGKKCRRVNTDDPIVGNLRPADLSVGS